MWVRGLKLAYRGMVSAICGVAPYVGAWIETDTQHKRAGAFCVAPYVGAWIETLNSSTVGPSAHVAPYVGAWIETAASVVSLPNVLSHPMWVRGLKRAIVERLEQEEVAPYVGAWIETRAKSCCC